MYTDLSADSSQFETDWDFLSQTSTPPEIFYTPLKHRLIHEELKMNAFKKILLALFVLGTVATVRATIPLPQKSSAVLRPTKGLFLRVTGIDGEKGPTLIENGQSVCPKDYKNGFTILCEGYSAETSSASFYVDGKYVRTEGLPPYSINGDTGDVPNAWNGYKDVSTIGCTTSSGESIAVVVDFSCGSSLDPIDKKKAEIPEASPEASPQTPKATSNSTCVMLDALYASSVIPSNWDQQKDGLMYKPNGGAGVESKGTDPVSYAFTVQKSGVYAIEMDSTAPHSTEHNDVWMRIKESGIAMRRGSEYRSATTDWIKVYQNSGGRLTQARSVDHTPFSIMTGRALEVGEKVTLEISGRSSKFLVHAFYLFPCNGAECESTSQTWIDSLDKCTARADS